MQYLKNQDIAKTSFDRCGIFLDKHGCSFRHLREKPRQTRVKFSTGTGNGTADFRQVRESFDKNGCFFRQIRKFLIIKLFRQVCMIISTFLTFLFDKYGCFFRQICKLCFVTI